LAILEELLILPDVEIVGAREVTAARKLERKLRVVERLEDIRNDGRLVNCHRENLAALVDANYTVRLLVFCGYKDGFSRNTIHIYASTGFQIIEVNEAKLCDEVDDSVLLRHLHRNWEIVRRLWRKINIDCLFGEGRIGLLVVDLYNVELMKDLAEPSYQLEAKSYLGAGSCTDSEGEKLCWILTTIKLKLGKRCSMPFNRLADSTLTGIKLHSTADLERRGIRAITRDANEDKPFLV
jgi:hypothetical protein